MKKLLLNGRGDYLNMESNLKIVVVNGMPRSGKTTFENFCKDYLGPYCEIISTIDIIKEMARVGGWNGEKDPKSRKLLSDLKDLWTNYNDLSFNTIKKHINIWEEELKNFHVDNQPHVLFVDSREPEEIARFKYELGAITVLVRRPEVENVEQSNHADANVLNFKYDYYILNQATTEELKSAAIDFINLLFKKN